MDGGMVDKLAYSTGHQEDGWTYLDLHYQAFSSPVSTAKARKTAIAVSLQLGTPCSKASRGENELINLVAQLQA